MPLDNIGISCIPGIGRDVRENSLWRGGQAPGNTVFLHVEVQRAALEKAVQSNCVNLVRVIRHFANEMLGEVSDWRIVVDGNIFSLPL